MTVYMLKAARHLRANIGRGIETALANRTNGAGWWAVFAFVLLMITREGMETALVLSSLAMERVRRPCSPAPCWVSVARR